VKPVNSKEKQKKKKESKGTKLLELAFLRNRTVQVFLASSALGSVGMYTPLFYLGEHVRREEEGEAALLLLHLWLGLAATSGCLLAGYITTSDSYNFYISRRLLVQVSLYGAACSMFCLYLVRGFHGLVMVAAMYGLFLGIHLYSTKVFTYSIVRSKEFSRLWSVVQGVQAVPSLAGVALTGLLNSPGDRTGYWLPISACILAGGLLTLLPPLQPRAPNTAPRPPSQPSKKFSASNGVSMTSDSKVERFLGNGGLQHGVSFSRRSLGTAASFVCPPPSPNPNAPSDPELAPWRSQEGGPGGLRRQEGGPGGLRRQTTWHKLVHPAQDTKEQDRLIIDQITSTV